MKQEQEIRKSGIYCKVIASKRRRRRRRKRNRRKEGKEARRKEGKGWGRKAKMEGKERKVDPGLWC